MEFSKNKKAQDSQRRIYKGLWEILKRKDLKDITIVDIQKECNISRTTFYRNFSNIIDVLEVIFKWYYNEYEELRINELDQLSFFFKYWFLHRDLLTIIVDNKLDILKKSIIKYSNNKNPIFIEAKHALIASTIMYWSKTDRNLTPEEYEKMVINELGLEIAMLLVKWIKCLHILFFNIWFT